MQRNSNPPTCGKNWRSDRNTQKWHVLEAGYLRKLASFFLFFLYEDWRKLMKHFMFTFEQHLAILETLGSMEEFHYKNWKDTHTNSEQNVSGQQVQHVTMLGVTEFLFVAFNRHTRAPRCLIVWYKTVSIYDVSLRGTPEKKWDDRKTKINNLTWRHVGFLTTDSGGLIVEHSCRRK